MSDSPAILQTSSIQARRSIRLFYGLRLLDNLAFMLPVWVLFGTEFMELSYTQTIIVMSVPVFLIGGFLQVPGGIVADRFGRKNVYLVGAIIGLAAATPFFFTNDFAWLLLTVPFAGIGEALRAGSIEAIVSVTCDEHEDLHFRKIAARGQTFVFVGRIIGSTLGGFLYSVHPLLAFGAPTVALVLALVLVSRLPDVSVKAAPADSVKVYVSTALRVFHGQNDIWKLLVLVAIWFFISDMAWLAYQPAFVDVGYSPGSLGLLFTLISLFSALGTELFGRKTSHLQARAILSMAGLAGVLAYGGFALVAGPAIAAAALPAALFGSAVVPLATGYVAERSPSESRATALSFVQLFWGHGTIGSWFVGSAILDRGSPQTVFALTTGLAVVFTAAAMLSGLRSAVDPRKTRGPAPSINSEAGPLTTV